MISNTISEAPTKPDHGFNGATPTNQPAMSAEEFLNALIPPLTKSPMTETAGQAAEVITLGNAEDTSTEDVLNVLPLALTVETEEKIIKQLPFAAGQAMISNTSGFNTVAPDTVPEVLESFHQTDTVRLPANPTETSESNNDKVQNRLDVSPAETKSVLTKDLARRPESFELTANEMARVPARRVAEALGNEIPMLEQIGFKKIMIQLHPAELGKLTLYVGWENETLKAQIVASESATSELLTRDKDFLMDTMQASGFDLASFDVSYDNSHASAGESEFNNKFPELGQSETDITDIISTTQLIGDRGSVVNIVV